jgi:hypothetical protein
MSDISDRIQYLVETEANGSAEKFGEKIGISGQAVRNMSKLKRSKPNVDVVITILQTFVWINPDWLLLGNEPKYRKDISTENCTSGFSPEWLLKRIEELAIENNDLKKEICRLSNSKKNNLENVSAEYDI